jgi:hypothetical protein
MFEDYATDRYSLADLAEMAKREGLFVGRETARVTATFHWILTNPFFYREFRHRGKLYRGIYPACSVGSYGRKCRY